MENNSHKGGHDDAELLARLKSSAAKLGYTPGALLRTAEAAAEHERISLIPIYGPFPVHVEEFDIQDSHITDWPDWVKDLMPAGSRWERLDWPDGSVSVRLLSPGGQVLAAKLVSTPNSPAQPTNE